MDLMDTGLVWAMNRHYHNKLGSGSGSLWRQPVRIGPLGIYQLATTSTGTTGGHTGTSSTTGAVVAHSSTTTTTSSTSSSTTGGLPIELEVCDLDAGCTVDSGIPLQCIPLNFTLQDGGSFTVNECVQTCGSTSDCIDSVTSCQYNVCYYNFCSVNASPYSSCNAAGSNDGQCYPESIGDGETIGLCFQTGTGTALNICGGNRNDTAPLCSSDNPCIDPTPDGGTYCYEACDISGILPCDAGTCVSLSIYGANTGICVTQCNSAVPCPTTQLCSLDYFCVPKSMAVE